MISEDRARIVETLIEIVNRNRGNTFSMADLKKVHQTHIRVADVEAVIGETCEVVRRSKNSTTRVWAIKGDTAAFIAHILTCK